MDSAFCENDVHTTSIPHIPRYSVHLQTRMHLARAAARAGSSRPLIGLQRCHPNRIHVQAFSALVSNWDNRHECQFMSNHPQPPSSSGSKLSSPWKRQRQQQFTLQQVRFRRHDRASAFSKPRPPTQKQRKEYGRKMNKIQAAKAVHSAPGSRAGPRRQWMEDRWQELLDTDTQKKTGPQIDQESLEYGYGDALLDDIVGNTSYLTSQQSPEPRYLGHKHSELYKKVAYHMERYRDHIQQVEDSSEQDTTKSLLDLSTVSLPSDKSISNVLRAYRDRNGTRNKPIGIVNALQHILKDLGIPTGAFGENTYTTLLTCCRTPKEARRIFKLMQDNQHSISAYSWSILVDVHSKVGDFQGCAGVIKEMASEGVPPTMAAYTCT
jgi:pentatricopeptide repeat protein